GLIRDGWSSIPGLFDVACGYALGIPSARVPYKRALRAAYMRQQFLRLIPDYDYSADPSTAILLERDPKDGRRHGHVDYIGNRFCHLASEKRKGNESISTGRAEEHDASAGVRSRSWTGADDHDTVSRLAGSTGSAGLPDLDRRRPPKRINSPAQLDQRQTLDD